jgi:hypothetical protein
MNLNEQNYIHALCDITNKSNTQIRDMIKNISADDYINLVAAVDKNDIPKVNQILSTVENSDQDKLNIGQIKKRINAISKDDDMDWDEKKDQLVDLISSLKSKDWDLIWPSLNKNMLRQLYKLATKKDTKTISADEAKDIWTLTKDDTTMEQVVYENQIVEMKIANGPNNTVGILLDNILTMVPKTDISQLTEHVFGIIGMPSLARVRELAGLDSAIEEITEAKESVELSANQAIDQCIETVTKIMNNAITRGGPKYESLKNVIVKSLTKLKGEE